MDRTQLLELWNDMWQEGNWVPSLPDSLKDLTPAQAAWSPGEGAHSIWQEVSHIVFWRTVTLDRMAGKPGPDEDRVAREEFAVPENPDASAWLESVAALERTQSALAAAIGDESVDLSRVPYHLIHDAYHLGRITQTRAMQGTAPKF